MERLRHKDLGALLGLLRESYSPGNVDTYVERVLAGLRKLVPARLAVYCEMDLEAGTSANWKDPPGFATDVQDAAWERVMHEHPALGHFTRTRDGRAHTISDFYSRARYHRTALFNEFYRGMGVEEDLNMVVGVSGSHIIGVSLHRGWRRFTARDRLLLNLMRVHLAQAWQNARLFTQLQERLQVLDWALERLDEGVVVLDPSGRVRAMTALARQYLGEYFTGDPASIGHLPETLHRWMLEEEARLASDGVPPPPRAPYVVEREGRRLLVRLLSDADRKLLLFEEEPGSATAPGHRGLTARERTVLAWVAQGKTNAEVGTILGISPRTAQKHLEHIFDKLGVETRTAAAALALGDTQFRRSAT